MILVRVRLLQGPLDDDGRDEVHQGDGHDEDEGEEVKGQPVVLLWKTRGPAKYCGSYFNVNINENIRELANYRVIISRLNYEFAMLQALLSFIQLPVSVVGGILLK